MSEVHAARVGQGAPEIAEVLEQLHSDERARLLDEMPAGVAGRMMTPQHVSVRVEMTAQQALDRVRRGGIDAEAIYLRYAVDDAIAVLEREDTEDVLRIGGTSPLDEPYLTARVLRVFRARVGWLLVLFVAEPLTGTIMRAFEDSLQSVVALAFFVPLLIDTGGNAGSQTTTTIVRAMASGEGI